MIEEKTEPRRLFVWEMLKPLKILRLRVAKEVLEKARTLEISGSQALIQIRDFFVALERTEEGYELMLLEKIKEEEKLEPLTPRLSLRKLEHIIRSPKFVLFRRTLGDDVVLARLLIELQWTGAKLEVPAEKKPRKLRRGEEEIEEISAEELLLTPGEEEGYIIHPAGGITPDRKYTYEYSVAPSREDPRLWINVIAWYNNNTNVRGLGGFRDGASTVEIEGKTFFLSQDMTAQPGILNFMNLDGLRKWMEGYAPEPYDVWRQALAFSRKYVFFMDPKAYYVLTAWKVATHFFMDMSSFPCLNPLGPVEAGKSTVLRIIRQLGYHATDLLTQPSEASIFRFTSAYLATLNNDEGDKIAYYDPNIRALFESGFNRGAKVPRQVKVGDEFKTVFFDAFCPRALTSKKALLEALDSRAIKLWMRGQPPRGKDYSRFEGELLDLSTGKDLRDDLYICRLLLHKRVQEEYEKLDLYEEYKDSYRIRGREASLFKPLVAVIRVFCGPQSIEEEYVIKYASKHGELRAFRKRMDMEAKVTKAIITLLQTEHPSEYSSLQDLCVAVIKGQARTEQLMEEIKLTFKGISKNYVQLYQRDMTPEDRGYVSKEKMAHILYSDMGLTREQLRPRRVIIPIAHLIHNIQRYEYYEEMDVPEPKTIEEEMEREKGLRKYLEKAKEA